MRSKQLQSWEHRPFATFPTICSFWCWDFDKEDNIKLFISLSLSLKLKETTTICVSLGCWLYHLPKGRIIVRFREFQRVALMAAAVGGRGRSLNDQENYHVDGLALLGRPPEWTGRWSLGGFQLMGAQKLSKAEMSFWFSGYIPNYANGSFFWWKSSFWLNIGRKWMVWRFLFIGFYLKYSEWKVRKEKGLNPASLPS